jgi:hypothetical protein
MRTRTSGFVSSVSAPTIQNHNNESLPTKSFALLTDMLNIAMEPGDATAAKSLILKLAPLPGQKRVTMRKIEEWLFWKLYHRHCKRASIEHIRSMQSWLDLDIRIKKDEQASWLAT